MKKIIFPLSLIAFLMLQGCKDASETKHEEDQISSSNSNKLPYEDPEFQGKIGRTYKDSEMAWPDLPTPPKDAPNVIVILLDDVGFGMTSTFGGSIPTPNLDKLADNGLRYNRFHTTAICGPSRAALLTGRNHHNSGSGFLAEWATGFPSYTTMIPRSTATVGKVMKYNGMNTSWFGKNHNTPDWETSAVGPFDRWPTGLGFDYFYGFNAGETHQYYPVVFENTVPVEPDKTPEEGYHFMTDMTDKAISWMQLQKSISPEKPVFMYFAPGAAHAPHHVTQKWRDQFKGKFDHGWDKEREITYERQKKMGIIPADAKLSPRNEKVPTWDSRSAEEKKFYSLLYENFAGFLAFTDHEVGRLIDAVNQLPDADNTLIMYIVGDNGASAEGGLEGTINEIKGLNGISSTIAENLEKADEIGGPSTEPHFPVGWAFAGNTPFPWVKQVASHFGGTRNPMVVSWPKVIKDKGGIRSQFLHLIDVVPTILEATGIQMPEVVDGVAQRPLDGKSFLSTFTDADAPEIRKTQYFEVFANRALYHEGWVATHQHTLPWRQDIAPGFEDEVWQLYNIKDDFSEAIDVSSEHPEKLKELQDMWEVEAEKYHVFPLDDRGSARLAVPKPSPLGDRKSFTFYEGATRIPETAAPNTKNTSWTMEAMLETTPKAKDGVINAIGGLGAGYTLYVKDGYPTFLYNFFESDIKTIKSTKKLPDGLASVKIDFKYDGGGAGKGGVFTLFVNNEKVGESRIEATVAGRYGIDTFGIGEDSGSPVTHNYKAPFKYQGQIKEVTIDLK
ncbi:arylsulfatase [Formosa algae]|uniref:Arylsulfatase n=1 Tax=Formosa algae TaxID=225843 RepID=A0A9X0YHY0_9FLAO|nr:arylsulfatase [Formosa algae]MBP1838615.1 arylsulfatase [Formosa algae]MDQ0335115.1 arylsulfatase [Formosa algae]OEI80470.1 arylsulfatase [Formosa algae]